MEACNGLTVNKLSEKTASYKRLRKHVLENLHTRNTERFKVGQVSEICSPTLMKYYQVRNAWQSEGLDSDSTTDHFAFLDVSYEHVSLVKDVCEKGLLCGNIKQSILGDPRKAVQLSRHPDVVQYKYRKNYASTLLMFKIMKGRVRAVSNTHNDDTCVSLRQEPMFNFNTRICLNPCLSTSYEQFYLANMYYLYQHNDTNILTTIPAQICPVAFVDVVYSEDCSFRSNSEADVPRPRFTVDKFLAAYPATDYSKHGSREVQVGANRRSDGVHVSQIQLARLQMPPPPSRAPEPMGLPLSFGTHVLSPMIHSNSLSYGCYNPMIPGGSHSSMTPTFPSPMWPNYSGHFPSPTYPLPAVHGTFTNAMYPNSLQSYVEDTGNVNMAMLMPSLRRPSAPCSSNSRRRARVASLSSIFKELKPSTLPFATCKSFAATNDSGKTPAPTITGQAPAPTITGQAPAPTNTGQAPAPTITRQAPAATVAGQAPAATVAGQTPAPTNTGQAPAPTITGQAPTATVTGLTFVTTSTSQRPTTTSTSSTTATFTSLTSVATSTCQAPVTNSTCQAPTTTSTCQGPTTSSTSSKTPTFTSLTSVAASTCQAPVTNSTCQAPATISTSQEPTTNSTSSATATFTSLTAVTASTCQALVTNGRDQALATTSSSRVLATTSTSLSLVTTSTTCQGTTTTSACQAPATNSTFQTNNECRTPAVVVTSTCLTVSPACNTPCETTSSTLVLPSIGSVTPPAPQCQTQTGVTSTSCQPTSIHEKKMAKSLLDENYRQSESSVRVYYEVCIKSATKIVIKKRTYQPPVASKSSKRRRTGGNMYSRSVSQELSDYRKSDQLATCMCSGNPHCNRYEFLSPSKDPLGDIDLVDLGKPLSWNTGELSEGKGQPNLLEPMIRFEDDQWIGKKSKTSNLRKLNFLTSTSKFHSAMPLSVGVQGSSSDNNPLLGGSRNLKQADCFTTLHELLKCNHLHSVNDRIVQPVTISGPMYASAIVQPRTPSYNSILDALCMDTLTVPSHSTNVAGAPTCASVIDIVHTKTTPAVSHVINMAVASTVAIGVSACTSITDTFQAETISNLTPYNVNSPFASAMVVRPQTYTNTADALCTLTTPIPLSHTNSDGAVTSCAVETPASTGSVDIMCTSTMSVVVPPNSDSIAAYAKAVDPCVMRAPTCTNIEIPPVSTVTNLTSASAMAVGPCVFRAPTATCIVDVMSVKSIPTLLPSTINSTVVPNVGGRVPVLSSLSTITTVSDLSDETMAHVDTLSETVLVPTGAITLTDADTIAATTTDTEAVITTNVEAAANADNDTAINTELVLTSGDAMMPAIPETATMTDNKTATTADTETRMAVNSEIFGSGQRTLVVRLERLPTDIVVAGRVSFISTGDGEQMVICDRRDGPINTQVCVLPNDMLPDQDVQKHDMQQRRNSLSFNSEVTSRRSFGAKMADALRAKLSKKSLINAKKRMNLNSESACTSTTTTHARTSLIGIRLSQSSSGSNIQVSDDASSYPLDAHTSNVNTPLTPTTKCSFSARHLVKKKTGKKAKEANKPCEKSRFVVVKHVQKVSYVSDNKCLFAVGGKNIDVAETPRLQVASENLPMSSTVRIGDCDGSQIFQSEITDMESGVNVKASVQSPIEKSLSSNSVDDTDYDNAVLDDDVFLSEYNCKSSGSLSPKVIKSSNSSIEKSVKHQSADGEMQVKKKSGKHKRKHSEHSHSEKKVLSREKKYLKETGNSSERKEKRKFSTKLKEKLKLGKRKSRISKSKAENCASSSREEIPKLSGSLTDEVDIFASVRSSLSSFKPHRKPKRVKPSKATSVCYSDYSPAKPCFHTDNGALAAFKIPKLSHKTKLSAKVSCAEPPIKRKRIVSFDLAKNSVHVLPTLVEKAKHTTLSRSGAVYELRAASSVRQTEATVLQPWGSIVQPVCKPPVTKPASPQVAGSSTPSTPTSCVASQTKSGSLSSTPNSDANSNFLSLYSPPAEAVNGSAQQTPVRSLKMCIYEDISSDESLTNSPVAQRRSSSSLLQTKYEQMNRDQESETTDLSTSAMLNTASFPTPSPQIKSGCKGAALTTSSTNAPTKHESTHACVTPVVDAQKLYDPSHPASSGSNSPGNPGVSSNQLSSEPVANVSINDVSASAGEDECRNNIQLSNEAEGATLCTKGGFSRDIPHESLDMSDPASGPSTKGADIRNESTMRNLGSFNIPKDSASELHKQVPEEINDAMEFQIAAFSLSVEKKHQPIVDSCSTPIQNLQQPTDTESIPVQDSGCVESLRNSDQSILLQAEISSPSYSTNNLSKGRILAPTTNQELNDVSNQAFNIVSQELYSPSRPTSSCPTSSYPNSPVIPDISSNQTSNEIIAHVSTTKTLTSADEMYSPSRPIDGESNGSKGSNNKYGTSVFCDDQALIISSQTQTGNILKDKISAETPDVDSSRLSHEALTGRLDWLPGNMSVTAPQPPDHTESPSRQHVKPLTSSTGGKTGNDDQPLLEVSSQLVRNSTKGLVKMEGIVSTTPTQSALRYEENADECITKDKEFCISKEATQKKVPALSGKIDLCVIFDQVQNAAKQVPHPPASGATAPLDVSSSSKSTHDPIQVSASPLSNSSDKKVPMVQVSADSSDAHGPESKEVDEDNTHDSNNDAVFNSDMLAAFVNHGPSIPSSVTGSFPLAKSLQKSPELKSGLKAIDSDKQEKAELATLGNRWAELDPLSRPFHFHKIEEGALIESISQDLKISKKMDVKMFKDAGNTQRMIVMLDTSSSTRVGDKTDAQFWDSCPVSNTCMCINHMHSRSNVRVGAMQWDEIDSEIVRVTLHWRLLSSKSVHIVNTTLTPQLLSKFENGKETVDQLERQIKVQQAVIEILSSSPKSSSITLPVNKDKVDENLKFVTFKQIRVTDSRAGSTDASFCANQTQDKVDVPQQSYAQLEQNLKTEIYSNLSQASVFNRLGRKRTAEDMVKSSGKRACKSPTLPNTCSGSVTESGKSCRSSPIIFDVEGDADDSSQKKYSSEIKKTSLPTSSPIRIPHDRFKSSDLSYAGRVPFADITTPISVGRPEIQNNKNVTAWDVALSKKRNNKTISQHCDSGSSKIPRISRSLSVNTEPFSVRKHIDNDKSSKLASTPTRINAKPSKIPVSGRASSTDKTRNTSKSLPSLENIKPETGVKIKPVSTETKSISKKTLPKQRTDSHKKDSLGKAVVKKGNTPQHLDEVIVLYQVSGDEKSENQDVVVAGVIDTNCSSKYSKENETEAKERLFTPFQKLNPKAMEYLEQISIDLPRLSIKRQEDIHKLQRNHSSCSLRRKKAAPPPTYPNNRFKNYGGLTRHSSQQYRERARADAKKYQLEKDKTKQAVE